nr:hypothetical protein [Tanacetum cinerariifolium]GEX76680.1 hypothetical protein [Tanacetum cinerariifolium]
MGRDTVQLETAVSTISQEYLLEFIPEYGIPEFLHPELPGPEDTIIDFSEGKVDVAPNPTKVKTGLCSCAADEVLLLTATVSRVIDVEDLDAATESSGTPSTIEKSSLDFDNENPSQQITVEVGVEEEIVAMGPPLSKKRCKRGNDGDDENAPPKMLRKDHAASRSTQNTIGRKSLASMGLEAGSTFFAPAPQETPADVRDSDPLSYATPPSNPVRYISQSSHGATVAGDPDSKKSSSFTFFVGSPGNIYQPGWGVTSDCRPDTSTACQYNMNLARQVAMGSQFRLRFEQEVRLRKRATKRIAKQEQRIQVREEEIKKLDQEVQGLQNQMSNLKTLLEAEADMKKAAKAKNADLTKELESLRTQFSDLHVNSYQLSQQVSNLQAQVTGEERVKAVFEKFKIYEDERVKSRCVKMGARLDAMSIDFDEELYPHMLTAIAGRRWVIGHGLRLAVMKRGESPKLSAGLVKGLSEGLAHGIEHEKADRDLEGLNDAPMEVIMASLHLESDSGEDAPKGICDLRPSTSQLKILVYLKIRDLRNPWAVKGEMLLEDAIAANMTRAEKKKKCRVVCRTHGVGSAHHAGSDGVPVSVPTVAPQGLTILLTDAVAQTKTSEDDAWAETRVGKRPQALEESLPHYK